MGSRHFGRLPPFMAQRPPQLIDQLALRRDLRAQRRGVRFQGRDAGRGVHVGPGRIAGRVLVDGRYGDQPTIGRLFLFLR